MEDFIKKMIEAADAAGKEINPELNTRTCHCGCPFFLMQKLSGQIKLVVSTIEGL